MRIFLRDNILEILKTVVDGISFAISGADGSSGVLADCADALDSIDDSLRDSLSSERASFYTELTACLRNAVNTLSDLSGDALNDTLDSMDNAISVLFEELTNESEVKAEIVFFPYKAAMWDSMESVWRAAREDSRCNAIVVPIPYYEKHPDGSFGRISYEGRSFPKHVPVVHYDDYDHFARHPDIAYIHNPYDDNNYISSVDPRWYSTELKKCVGTLVYIPYYVNMRASNAEMCSCAAYGAADIIIAHNDRDVKSYSAYGTLKDVVSLGSPKLDRVLQADNGKKEIPDEWKYSLEGKKIFLLITTVNIFLSFDKSGEKLRKLIDLFKNRDDIALIWRPHPLEAATLSSMRTEQLEAYLELEKYVTQSGFCVLDRTADVSEVIAISDAYLGAAGSSVCYMYKVTGKPIYSIDFDSTDNFTKDDYEEALRAEFLVGSVSDGDYLWGSCANFNGLARLDTRDGTMEYMGRIPGEFSGVQFLFGAAIKIDSKLILTPMKADVFAEYDISSGAFKTVPLPTQARVDVGKNVFGAVIDYGDYIYFAPSYSRVFARYRKSTDEYEYLSDWYRHFERYITRDDRPLFSGAALVGERLFLTSQQNSIVAEFNLETLEFRVHKLTGTNYRFAGIVHDRRYLWLTRFVDPSLPDRSDSVVRWDYRTGRVKEFDKFPDGFELEPNHHTHLGGLIDCGNYFLALPFFGNMLVRLDKETGKMSEFDTGLGIDFRKRCSPIYAKGSFAAACVPSPDKLFLTAMYDYSLLEIDLKRGKTEKRKQRFVGSAHEESATELKRFKFKYIYRENVLFRPEHFIERCISGEIPERDFEQAEYFRSFVENADGSCGIKVHEYVLDYFLAMYENGLGAD